MAPATTEGRSLRAVHMIAGHAPNKAQRYRKKLAVGRVNISPTLMVQNTNSTDLERGAAPQLKSVEFVFYTKRVGEIFDVHTDFTAGQMLYLTAVFGA